MPVTFFGVPPEPWPDIPAGYAFGPEWQPPGTIYTFTESQALARFAEHGHLSGLLELYHLLRVIIINGTANWEMPMRYVRAQVHASLGADEDIIHSLGLVHSAASETITGQVIHDLALVIGDCFHAFMTATGVQAAFSPDLTYDEVRVSYIEQTDGTAKDGSGGNQTTLIPTIVVPMNTPISGNGGAKTLPYEVAMALTLNTDTRGPRTRGRTYLGGLDSVCLGTNGKFQSAVTGAIGAAYGAEVIETLHSDTAWRVNIISRRSASSREVQGLSVGVVPDSQRRRRRNQDEARTLAWGTAAGAIPPAS